MHPNSYKSLKTKHVMETLFPNENTEALHFSEIVSKMAEMGYGFISEGTILEHEIYFVGTTRKHGGIYNLHETPLIHAVADAAYYALRYKDSEEFKASHKSYFKLLNDAGKQHKIQMQEAVDRMLYGSGQMRIDTDFQDSMKYLVDNDLSEYFELFLGSTEDKPVNKVDSCTHNWQTYTGLMETYSFCTKCNEKDVDNK